MASVDRPHMRYPFSRGVSGSVVVVEQDTEDHVASCEAVIVVCPSGFRVTRPEFGWPFPTFKNAPLSVEALEHALRTFEPRSTATATEYAALADQATRRIDVTDEATRNIDVIVPVQEDENG